jgi:hypothetical protein
VTGSGDYVFRGGGIYFEHASGTLQDCLIDSNGAVQGGGISFILSDSVTLTNCVFYHDTTDSDAGAVYLQYSSPTFLGCSFINNVAGFGVGVEVELYSHPTFNNCLFTGNIGYSGAGLGLIDYASATVTSCTFYGNSAEDGAGITMFSGREGYPCNITLVNTIIASSARGSAIYCQGDSTFATLSNCDIYGNPGGNWSGCVANQYGLRGNISSNPLFRNTSQSNFRLRSDSCGFSTNSPCIDAGDSTIADSLLDCAWGLGTERSDIGAFGGGGNIITDIRDEQRPLIPVMAMLYPNYPNPFNPTTSIQYYCPKSVEVVIEIFDIIGRKVGTLVDARQEAGRHSVIWNGDNKSSGIYFYRIKVGDYTETRKMLLLK